MSKTMSEIRDAEADRIANQYAQPVIRSMYPSLSRGEMARKFKEVFSFGFQYRDKLDNEALKIAKEVMSTYDDQAVYKCQLEIQKLNEALKIAVDALERIIACSNFPSYPEPVESKIAKKILTEIRKLKGEG